MSDDPSKSAAAGDVALKAEKDQDKKVAKKNTREKKSGKDEKEVNSCSGDKAFTFRASAQKCHLRLNPLHRRSSPVRLPRGATVCSRASKMQLHHWVRL